MLYNLLYLVALAVASPWMLWRYMVQKKNRRGWKQKLLGLVPQSDPAATGPCIWFHAVSVGEVNLLPALIRRLQASDALIRFAISTSTETGFDLANRKFPDHNVFFCPMDFSWAVRNAIKRVKPDMLVLTELELWPNLINIPMRHGIDVIVVNARLSESSFKGYKRIGWLVRSALKNISLIAVQNEVYATRFLDLGCNPERVRVTGNVKFDGAMTTRSFATDNPGHAFGIQLPVESSLQDPVVERQLSEGAEPAGAASKTKGPIDHVWVAGSTQPEEDSVVIEVYEQLLNRFPQLRLVLVPRHPEKITHACELMRERNIPFVRRSEMGAGRGSNVEVKPVIVVDVIGELASWWSLANVAYVGGSMGSRRGGQNMIEPSALGVPVCFGPQTRNFKAVVSSLLTEEAAIVVRDAKELARFIAQTITDAKVSTAMGQRARAVVVAQQGAADRTVGMILDVLTQSTGCSRASQRRQVG